MCLTVINKVITNPTPTPRRAYKVYHIVYPYDISPRFYTGKPHVPDEPIDNSPVQYDKWLTAASVLIHPTIVTDYRNKTYQSGFHCYLSRTNAQYVVNQLSESNIVIPVQISHIQTLGEQGNHRVIVCQRMKVSSRTVHTRVIQWAKRQLSEKNRVPHTFKRLGLPLTFDNAYIFKPNMVAVTRAYTILDGEAELYAALASASRIR